MKLIPVLRLALVVILGGSLFAQAEKTSTLPAALQGIAIAEVPAEAATLIAAAKPDQREMVATEVVSGTVKTYPAIATAIVGAVCTKCPDLAAVVTKAAVSVQPKQAQLIVKAATAVAPKYTAEIESALVALSESDPTLKSTLRPLIASFQSPQLASVAGVTASDGTTEPAISGRLRGPVISGPYVPLSGTPTNTPPTTPVPPGGDYARP